MKSFRWLTLFAVLAFAQVAAAAPDAIDPSNPPDQVRTESSGQERRPGRFHTRLSMGMGQVSGTIERGEALADTAVSSVALAQALDFGVALTSDLALSFRIESYLPFDSEIPGEGKPSDALMLVGLAGPAIDYRLGRGFVLDAGAGVAFQSNGDPGFIQIFGRGAQESSYGFGVSGGLGYEGSLGRGWQLGVGARVFAMPWSSGRYDGHDANDFDTRVTARLLGTSLHLVAAYN